ncbi:hypothetical protein [Mesorhizobium helmanticense]|uniref:Uncharacterized protein n=1 Tax=Mesorhizobium helmanticense TaxID=1776423 RepID=A0A2T4ILW2_9HYPH|nr:hypothetical protein [Mesorhizobium helmanticense]PTE06618.1 hypothetical protein C9427_30840 [Mesorhizobium helmanticense]
MMEIVLVIILAAGGYYFYKRSRAVSPSSGSREWMRDFVVYHVAALFQSALPGKLPDEVVALIRGEASRSDEVQLLGSMQNYTAYKFKTRSSIADLPAVREDARQFLRAELDTMNSTSALRRFIRRMHKLDTGNDIAEAELAQQFEEIRSNIKADDDKARAISAMMLRDSIEEFFERKHGKPIRSFLEDMVADDGV